MKLGVINYSALARTICESYQIPKQDAVIAACRRYAEKARGSERVEDSIMTLLSNAKLLIRNQVMVTILRKPVDFTVLLGIQEKAVQNRDLFNIIEGERSFTIVSADDYEHTLQRSFTTQVLHSASSLIQITLLFTEEIETTPGVVSHLYGLLAENGINVLEEMSCWTELMLILHERDLPRVMKVLNFKEKSI